mgnify:FL=1|tara:strand:+ start:3537 stop:4775 length:1239 start_codon:yes stop_codon:yes gene_type:complete
MTEKILVPNIGDFKNVEIIEVLVKEGDKINKGDPIITLESDKSSVEVPSTINGSIEKVKIKIGDKVSEGDLILTINPENKQVEKKKDKTIKEVKTSKAVKKTTATPTITQVASSGIVGASPNVMRFARELGVDLSQVHGTGRDGRVLEVDIKEHVKNIGPDLSSKKNIIEDMPYPHSEFGAIKVEKIPRIKRLSGPHLVNAWSTIPHVTQHDEIDVTEMETFRKNLTDLNTKEKIPITPIAFIIRALVNAMKRYPNFNSSIDPDKEEITFKKYFHIGIAVDTPHGLMVPKIRDVNNKDLSTISKELRKISKACKELKIDKKEFFGGSMTISSLGGIGGSFFTPIINPPEVCILGVGRTESKQIFLNGKFQRRMMMPISLSYDHRIIDGAEAARFCQDLKISLGRNFAFKLAI